MGQSIRLEIPAALGRDAMVGAARLSEEDALGQLLRRDGRMRELATEGTDVKLDWVDGVELALTHPEWIAAAEEEAAGMLRSGIRHIIWAGMGGSVQTVYALCRLGYFADCSVSLHPLDSTDPATLSGLLAELADLEGVSLVEGGASALRQVLDRTAMLGVSMGMTSEEPITHLEWFDGLLHEYAVPNASEHIQVMTLPGSYLDNFAQPRGSRMVPIQLDAQNHTAGRMSAPATRVFLRPVALRLVADALEIDPAATFNGSLLRGVLGRCQALSGLAHRQTGDERAAFTKDDPFSQLGAHFAAAAARGRNQVLVLTTPGWEGFAPWLEQLVEESLGKGGKGLLIFYGQDAAARSSNDRLTVLELRFRGEPNPTAADSRAAGLPVLSLEVPIETVADRPAGLGEMGALCLGFERMVAVFGYLRGIVFAGQPAVEAYKRYARELRDAAGPVPFPTESPARSRFGGLTLYYQSPLLAGLERTAVAESADAAEALAGILGAARRAGWLGYVDFTFNGEPTLPAREALERARSLVHERLGLLAKIRTGPSDYHSTEQSETDGPAALVSIRIVALEHEKAAFGRYSDKFLLAQARGTWQAMEDAHRWIVMITIPRLDDASLADLTACFERCFAMVA